MVSASMFLAAGSITKSVDALRIAPGTGTQLLAGAGTQPGTPTGQQATTQPTGAQAGTKPDVSNAPLDGQSGAKVQIVEFSDYQCPFCRKFFTDSLPTLRTNYVATGKVKIYWKDFPLPFHPDAPKEAEAARCAGDQGKYYPMHDAIFAFQQTKGTGTVSMNVDEIKSEAAKISGINTATFNACLDSGSKAPLVQADLAEGSQLGVGGTPSFFLVGGQYDRLNLASIKSTLDTYQITVAKASDGTAIFTLVGALPASAFTAVIDAQLAAS
jgi:protein-disulfide isomerase